MSRLLVPVLLLTFTGSLAAQSASVDSLSVFPPKIHLQGKEDRQRLLITARIAGKAVDVTRQAKLQFHGPEIARVSSDGELHPLADGEAYLSASFGGKEAKIPISVRHGTRFLPVTFEKDVQPVFARFGCNSGPCHGKSRGQNGFQLSLLGFDHDFDYSALTEESRGRRIFSASPHASLLLRKGSGQMPHGGGSRLPADHPLYDRLVRWIEAGMPRTPLDSPELLKITIEPAERILDPRAEQPLAVTAHFGDGSTQDVTHLALFQSNESAIAGVSADGWVKAGPLPGEAAIMARYNEKFAVATISIPLPQPVSPDVYAKLPRVNFIDDLVWKKLERLHILPSDLSTDARFLRRAYLDVLGRLPTPDEARSFLKDPSPEKRVHLIDLLLDRPEWADHWANKWADMLRPNPYRVGAKGVLNFDAWLRDAFRKNKPYDQFVEELLTAQGSNFTNGAVVFFRDRRDPEEVASVVSQLFLGIRLECAKCHHHPFEAWTQEDYFGFAAYFSRIGRKGVGIGPPISGGEEIFFPVKTGNLKHPKTGLPVEPKPLFGDAPGADSERDLRKVLTRWILTEKESYFAKVQVNRVWADLMGRGLVEPVDDLRLTNPPSNAPLLDALAEHFRQEKFDLKKLVRTILNSRVYQLASIPNDRNVGDTRNFSRHYRQRLRAEVLLDALTDITQVPETFEAAAPKTRAMELWTVRTQSIFLDSFGRPNPNQDPPCERTMDTTVVQALHLMNSPRLHAKVTGEKGRAATLAKSQKTPAEVVEELYLLVYSRFPTERERQTALALFAQDPRRQAVEDLLWALLNTAEFVFKD